MLATSGTYQTVASSHLRKIRRPGDEANQTAGIKTVCDYFYSHRGYGLFIGLEIVNGRENPQADSVTAKELVKR